MDLKLLNDELQQNISRRTAIREANRSDVLPEAERAEMDTLTKRADRIIDEIEKQKQREQDAALDRQRAYLDEPVFKVPLAIHPDQDGVKTLLASGWENKAGVLYAPTSLGKMQAMYSEDVLFGPIPDGPSDADRANYFKTTRAIMQPSYREAWLKWFRSPYHMTGGALSMLSSQEQKALSEGNDGSGGFAVPPDISAEFMVRRGQQSIMRQLATVRNTTRDIWKAPAVKANSTDTASRNIYTDQFVGAWIGETPSQASIDVAFEMFEIPIKKIRAYTLMSNDWIADAIGNMIQRLTQSGGKNMALVEDQGVIAGAGGLQPVGFLNHALALTLVASDGMAVDVEGTTSNTISNTVSDAGSAPKIKGLVYKLASQYAQNASWLMRRATQGEIAGLVDASGRPFWNSYLESGFSRPQMNIEGYPAYNSEFMGADGVVSAGAATIPLAFGDFSEVNIVERTAISVRVATERFIDSDQTGLFLFERVGSGLWNYDAIRTGVIYS